MSTFDFLWQLVQNHGSVAEYYKAELARVWDGYTAYLPFHPRQTAGWQVRQLQPRACRARERTKSQTAASALVR